MTFPFWFWGWFSYLDYLEWMPGCADLLMYGVDFSESCVVVDLEGDDFKERREIEDEGCGFSG